MKPVYIIQNWAPESPGTIGEYLDSEQIDHKVFANFDSEPLPDLDDCSAVIVLGCPHSANIYREFDWLVNLYAFVAEAVRKDTPYLGICFGGQLLAKVLGARVERNDVKEIGNYPVRLTAEGQTDSFFRDVDTEFEVFHWHADTFRIPHGATLLAEGDTCRNQAFRKRNAVAVQFHLEPTVADIPLWCNEYADELASEGKTDETIIEDFNAKADLFRQTNFQLVRNFLNSL